MAAIIIFPKKLTLTIFILLLINLIPIINSHQFSRRLSGKEPRLGKGKKTELHFFLHDLFNGRPLGVNSTTVVIARARTTEASRTRFGLLAMFDDPLTLSPDLNSTPMGRAQGVFGFADQNHWALMMAFTLVFTEGEYEGSTLSVLGRNTIEDTEMPIVGGTGVFRLAAGWVLANRISFESKTRNSVYEYKVTVYH